jgi:hypothetical protein
MAYKTNQDGQQRIMNHLADSVLELSDEEILAEVRESGADPQEEAERTSFVLRQATDTWESANERLSDLGHAINPNYWRDVDGIYHNNCQSCGSSVSFTGATRRLEGNILDGSCPETSTRSRKNRVSGG